MTQVDGLSLPVRLPIDGDAFDAACSFARANGLTISAAASEMLRSFAPPVERGSRPPAPEDGREGSGEPPASLPSVLSPAPTGYACIVDTCWDEGRDATWCDPDDRATAYCDDHIPDGWVKPDDTPPLTLEESKALHPSSRPVKVDTFLRPMPHIHPGAPPCVFGDRCGR